MSIFNNGMNVYYAPAGDGGGGGVAGIPNSAQPAAVQSGGGIPDGLTKKQAELENSLSTLAEYQENLYKSLNKLVGITTDEETSKDGLLGDLKESFAGIKEDITSTLSSTDLFSGLFGSEDSALGGLLGGGGGAKDITPKDRPTPNDLLALPAESSMGYLLLYWKLDELAGLLGSDKEGDGAKRSKGLGGFFKGLLEGAAGIALLAGALIIFAGATALFATLGPAEWASALFGMGMFALFVIGAIQVAKMVKQSIDDFVLMAIGVALLSVGLLLFGFSVKIMSEIGLDAIDAIPSLALFMLMVLGTVLLANAVSAGIPSFVGLGIGAIAMSASLIIFGLGIKVLAAVSNDILDALPGLAIFGVFILGMTAIGALFINVIPLLGAFAVASMLMSASLILFGLAIKAVVAIGPDIETAAPILIQMTLLMTGISVIGALAGVLAPLMVLMSVSMIAMSAAFTIFGLVVKFMATLTEEIDPAIDVMGKMTGFLLQASAAAILGSILAAPMVLFSAAILTFSLAMAAFSGVIAIVNAIGQEGMQLGLVQMKSMIDFLKSTGKAVGIVGLLVLPGMAAFSAGILAFSIGMLSFVEVIRQVSDVKEEIPSALEGLSSIMLFLTNPLGKLDSEGNPINAGQAPGVIQMMDTVGWIAINKLRMFGEALLPFSESMYKLTSAIALVAQTGDPAAIQSAVLGLGRIFGFLAGGGPDNFPREQSVIGVIDLYNTGGGWFQESVWEKLESFGIALLPFSDAMLKFADVVQKVANIDGSIPAAVIGIRSMFNFLAGDGDPNSLASQSSVLGMLEQANKKVFPKLEKFGEALGPFATAMDTFSNVVNNVGGFNQATIDMGIIGLGKMVDFLKMASKTVKGVGDGTGWFGTGDSELEKFANAVQPFSTAMGDFGGVISTLAELGAGGVDSAEGALSRMISMLKGVGIAGEGDADPRKVERFRDSLKHLGDGLADFFSEIQDGQEQLLDSIARSLEKIAQINFGNTFEPFINFVSQAEDINRVAGSLERISEALMPRQTSTLDQITNTLGGLFNGGSRTEIDEDAVIAQNKSGRNAEVDAAVLQMRDILSFWNDNNLPIDFTGEGREVATNTVLVGSGGRTTTMPGGQGVFGSMG